MASNIIIVDSDFITISRELAYGAMDINDIIKKYKVILETLTQKGIVDIAINNVLVTKAEKAEDVVKKLKPVINDIYTKSIKFIDDVEELDDSI